MRSALLTALIVFALVLICSAGQAQAQQTGTIAGTVTDSTSGGPLPGVNVVIEGTTQGASTGAQGGYRIEGLEPGAYTVRATFVGYTDKLIENVEVAAGQTVSVDVALQPSTVALDEVVAVGYGTQRREDLTGAVSSVSAEDIENVPVTSPEQVLKGQVAGVQVTSSSAPGGGTSIRIRGSGSINAGNEPLYVIDGFPVYSDNNASTPVFRSESVTPSALASINPNDIESIEVLKDASATAIYGARGANGVVLITTKSGRAGQARVSFDSYYGTQRVAKTYDVLNASQFAQLANEAAASRGDEFYFPNPEALGVGTDWQSLVYRPAPVQNYQLSVSGGNESARYLVSGNYFDQDGIIRGSNFKRYSFRANIDGTVSDRFSVGSNLTVSRTDNNSVPSEGNSGRLAGVPETAVIYYPTYDVYDEEGNYVSMANPPEPRLSPAPIDNPIALINELDNELISDRLLGNAFAEYAFMEGLSLRSSVGVDVDKKTGEYYGTRQLYTYIQSGGEARTASVDRLSLLNENVLTYEHTFDGAHDLEATGGFTWQTETTKTSRITSSHYVNDLTRNADIGAGNPPGGPSVGSSELRWQLASWIGRVNYAFDSKYLITATARADGSSKFGAGNKWGFFPSGALAWKASEEDFIQNLGLFSTLKARVSYGVTGNQEIGTYRSLARLSTSGYSFGREPVAGYAPVGVANPDLKWERTRQLDLGLDVGFLDERLRITADYYRKVTDDLLLNVTLPANSGFTSAIQNAGSVRNQGVELAVEADLPRKGVSATRQPRPRERRLGRPEHCSAGRLPEGHYVAARSGQRRRLSAAS